MFVERLSILIKNKTYYVAEVSQNASPTYFEITQKDDSGFLAENPEHDFPKKTDYQKKDKLLIATISGDGKEIPFTFKQKTSLTAEPSKT